MAIDNWSTTAGSNATVDSINWAENQAPSTVNDSARALMADVRTWYNDYEWRDWGHTVTYASATTFTVATDVTSIYVVDQPIRCTDATTLYGKVASRSYSAPNTTVTVTLDSGSLSASLTSVSLGQKPTGKPIDVSGVRGAVANSGNETIAGNKTFSGQTTFSDTATFTGVQYFDNTLGPGYIQNYSLSDAVAASAYTMTLSAYDGTALSSTNKAQFTFGNATAGTGTVSVVSQTANLTLTLSSGSTLGATSGTAFRLWWAIVNDAGTLRLAVINCSTATDQYSIGDDELITSTAEGGAGAADSAGVWYTGTAVTAKAARIIGYTEHSLATAGTWNEEADKMRLWQPGMKLPGDVVQVRIHEVTAFSTAGTTAIPYDNTIPQNTEGDQVLTKSATAKSAADLWRVDVVTHGSNSGNSHYTAALFQDSTANALVSASHWGVLDRMGQHQLSYTAVANSTSSTTFNVRIGAASGTTYLNGEGAAGLYGGTIRSYLRITEIMG